MNGSYLQLILLQLYRSFLLLLRLLSLRRREKYAEPFSIHTVDIDAFMLFVHLLL